ncbi:major facilitator superfamily domain-containing protein 4A-like [Mytilus galloprovincialis]|uniref:Major facilitator superfamily (MFS) profile domain-containing protein n=1 Tax=Mytilus galloprovincialis TaxID=29158 RepID=A0A8B6FRR6_MYTGA|nr:Hypothetical predicted protein [Mytilus galloprovincialis]
MEETHVNKDPISEKTEEESENKQLEYPVHPSDVLPEERVNFWKLFKENWLSILTDCLTFGSFGMGVAFLGPTLFDLGCQTSSDLKDMNWVIFAQLVMTLVGSISAGCLAKRAVPVYVLLLIGMVGLPLFMYLVPSCTVFAWLLVDLLLMGWCMGCIDCVANLRMIMRFGTNVTPFLQAMHFFYGLGAFISPMIAAPFLVNIDCTPLVDGVTSSSNSLRITRAQHLSKSRTAFVILGSIQLLITFIVVTVVTLEKMNIIKTGAYVSQSTSQHSLKTAALEKDERGGVSLKHIIIVTIMASISLFIYDGIQSSFGDYIYSYAEKSISNLRKEEGAFLNACFWGCFAFGRLLAIPLATRLTSLFMLSINLGGVLGASTLMLIFHTDKTVIYIGVCSLGLFLSSMTPTAISLAEQFININPSITSCLVVCAALGESLCPIIVGNLFALIGPPTFLTFCLSATILAVIFYVLLVLIGRRTIKYKEKPRTSFIFLYERKKAGESSLIMPSSLKYYSKMQEEPEENLQLGPIKSTSTE